MRRIAVRMLLAVGLIGMGWAAGRAQAPLPDFELVIDAPAGRTNIQCVRGCEGLGWIERMVPGTVPASHSPDFWFECSNAGNGRCGSGRVGGWLKR